MFSDNALEFAHGERQVNSSETWRPRTLMEMLAQTIRQPRPFPPKRPYASFLEDFVDPLHSNPASETHAESINGFVTR